MSGHDDLLARLRRSSEPRDRALAEWLGALRAAGHQPRASSSLAAFLAAQAAQDGAAPLDNTTEPVPAADLVVALSGRTPQRSSSMRSTLVPLRNLLRTSLLAKVVLGTTIALTGAGAVAATAGPDSSPDVVSVVPASDGDSSDTVGDEPPALFELDDVEDEDEEDGPDEDGPDPEDAQDDADDLDDAEEPDVEDDGPDDDQGEDADDQGEDADDQGEDNDDQGEDNDDQGDDADEDADDTEDAGDDGAADDAGDDDTGDGDEDVDDDSEDSDEGPDDSDD